LANVQVSDKSLAEMGGKVEDAEERRYRELFGWHLGVLFLLLRLIRNEICFSATDVIYGTYVYCC